MNRTGGRRNHAMFGGDPVVDVHFFPLDVATARLEELRALLNTEELARASHFIQEEHRRRFTVARGTLRVWLGERLGVPPESLEFSTGVHGKPFLAGPHAGAGLHFNLAHTGDLGVLALSTQGPLGVDVERVRPMDEMGLGGHVYSAGELALLGSCSVQARRELFFQLWTLKEAYIKATGEGMTAPLTGIHIRWDPACIQDVMAVDDSRPGILPLFLRLLAAPAGFTAALAAPGRGWRVRVL